MCYLMIDDDRNQGQVSILINDFKLDNKVVVRRNGAVPMTIQVLRNREKLKFNELTMVIITIDVHDKGKIEFSPWKLFSRVQRSQEV